MLRSNGTCLEQDPREVKENEIEKERARQINQIEVGSVRL